MNTRLLKKIRKLFKITTVHINSLPKCVLFIYKPSVKFLSIEMAKEEWKAETDCDDNVIYYISRQDAEKSVRSCYILPLVERLKTRFFTKLYRKIRRIIYAQKRRINRSKSYFDCSQSW